MQVCWQETAKTVFLPLLIAFAGGAVLTSLGLPAGWISGAMIAVSAACLSGMRTNMPNALRDGMFVLLGISMGAGVTPDVVNRVGQWPFTMLLLFVVVVLIIVTTFIFLHKLAKWHAGDAYFGAIPGALSFVMALMAERKVDDSLVLSSQSTRLLILVFVMPLVLQAGGEVPTKAPSVSAGMDYGHLVLLLGLCTAASFVADRLRVPAGWMTGAFLMSSGLNAFGIIPVMLPSVILTLCSVVLGAFIGTRLGGTTFILFLKRLATGLGAVAVGVTVSAALSVAGSYLFDIPFGQLMLAYAPGGLEVMTVLAFMLDLDPAFVVAHQLARYMGMIFLLPIITSMFFRYLSAAEKNNPGR